jgi:hypothetical protein
MALTLTTIQNSVLTSIYGRRLGLDSNARLVGPRGYVLEIEDITSTVATTASAFGLTRVMTSGSSQGPTQHNLPAPTAGVEKIIVMTSTSTGSQQFLSTPNGAAIYSSAGTTAGFINFVGPGGYVQLIGLSTTAWAVKAHSVTTFSSAT